TPGLRILPEVSNRVDDDQRTDPGDDGRKQDGEPVEVERERQAQARHPRDTDRERPLRGDRAREIDEVGGEDGGGQTEYSRTSGSPASQPAGDGRQQEWGQDHRDVNGRRGFAAHSD